MLPSRLAGSGRLSCGTRAASRERETTSSLSNQERIHTTYRKVFSFVFKLDGGIQPEVVQRFKVV